MVDKKRKYIFWSFLALVLIGALLAVSRSGYSDGDDAFFYRYANSMGFFEYLSWRYETWVGRMAAEALVYLVFSLDIRFWRAANAVMLVLLPMGILRLSVKAARIPEGSLMSWKDRKPAQLYDGMHNVGLDMQIAAVSGYFLMSIVTLGYAALWVNGSIFYTWSFTCGLWALMPYADFVFDGEAAAEKGTKLHLEKRGTPGLKQFFYTVPCAVVGAMSIEQMGAVLVVFELLAVLYGIMKWRKVNLPLLIQTAVTVTAFGILFAAPGNAVRVASEITNWMPEYETMPLSQHLFITAHWLLSSFANENKLFLVGIWIVGIVLLVRRRGRRTSDLFFAGAAGIFTIAAFLPYAGITTLSDFGMQYINTAACVDQVPRAEVMTGPVWFAMAWQGAALVFTFVFLWRVSGCQITLLLAYLAGIASEMIMFFSPTMYASGARVFYLTDLLYLFIILALLFGIREKKVRNVLCAVLLGLGVFNVLVQAFALFGA